MASFESGLIASATLDHLVVQDIFLTETATFADVVLPASGWAEKDGTVSNTDRRVQLGRATIPLPGEARQDLWIIRDIGKGIGLDWNYQHVSEVYDEMRGAMASISGITWERLERDGSVTYPCKDENDPGQGVVFVDDFPTSNGRAKLVAANLLTNEALDPFGKIPEFKFCAVKLEAA